MNIKYFYIEKNGFVLRKIFLVLILGEIISYIFFYYKLGFYIFCWCDLGILYKC